MDASFGGVLRTYVETPSADNYARLREYLIGRPEYDPYCMNLHEARTLLDQGDAQAAADHVRAHLIGMWLHPGAHLLLAAALDRLGHPEQASPLRGMAGLMMRAILGTGDGSPERPYVVAHIADEYTVLSALRKQSKMQRLISREGGPYDVHNCEDDSEVWFDISTPFGHMSRVMSQVRRQASGEAP